MRDSLLITLFFICGLLLSYYEFLPLFLYNGEMSNYILYVLLFVVGVNTGSDREAISVLDKISFKMLLVPVATIIGSLIATALFSIFVKDINIFESMAVGAGFGYYSLSSIMIGEIQGEELGTIALVANISRELATLLFAPLLVSVFGKLATIASGGATAMDTTLPVIMRYSGKEYGIIAVFSGVILTILVPFLVTFILMFV